MYNDTQSGFSSRKGSKQNNCMEKIKCDGGKYMEAERFGGIGGWVELAELKAKQEKMWHRKQQQNFWIKAPIFTFISLFCGYVNFQSFKL